MTIAVEQNIEEQLKAARTKRQAEQDAKERHKKGWYGLVYCEGEYASVADFGGKGICLGRTDEIIPYLKSKGINGENINSVIHAAEDFRAEQKEGQKNQEKPVKAKNEKPRKPKTQSCHLALKNAQPYISIPPPKPHRATFEDNPENLASQRPFFKKDPELLKLLESLCARDIGIPTIHRELNKKGYAVPYRTVGRWVAQVRSKELL